MAKFNENDHASEVEALANRLDGKLRKEFLASIQRLKDKDIDWKIVQKYLTDNRPDLVMSYLDQRLVANSFASFGQAVTNAFIAGGDLAAKLAPIFTTSTGVEINVSFNVANPELIGVMQRYQMNEIRGITDDVRASVQAVLNRTVAEGINPIQAARQIRQFIGLTDSQVRAVQNYRQMLEDRPLAALNSQLRDKRYDRTITRADLNASKLTSAQIDKMVERYAERYLNYRATTIARTESIRALNMANHQLWKSMVADGKIDPSRIKRLWVYSADDKTRAAHDGRQPDGIPSINSEGVGLDEPFQSSFGPIMYPGDPNGAAANVVNCRCTVFTKITG